MIFVKYVSGYYLANIRKSSLCTEAIWDQRLKVFPLLYLTGLWNETVAMHTVIYSSNFERL